MACPYRVIGYWKLTTHLNSAFRVHMPSPWYREKSQISCSKDRNTAVEEDGKRHENLSRISSVVAWPSTLHCVAMKSLISLRSSSWVSWCSPLPPLVGISWAFRDFIRASNTADEVLRDPFIQEEELADWPSKWLEDPTWKRYGIHAIKSIPLMQEINLHQPGTQEAILVLWALGMVTNLCWCGGTLSLWAKPVETERIQQLCSKPHHAARHLLH